MQETMVDVVEMLQQKEGQPVDTERLGTGFLCCMLGSIVSGDSDTVAM